MDYATSPYRCADCPYWLAADRIAAERDALEQLRGQLDGLEFLCTPIENRIVALTWVLAVLAGSDP